MRNNNIKIKYLVFQAKNQNNPEAFGKLYDLYVDKIFRFVRFKVNTDEETQDITSNIFLKTWQYLREGKRKIDNFNALIYRIARNCIIDHYRERNKNSVVSNTEQFEEIIADRKDAVKELDQKLDLEQIESKLKLLKEEYREVIILKYINGLTTSEIAKILDKSKSNIRVLLHRALKTLKEIFHD
ncbi:MAG TPA: RNA polymerase sigma factor [Candidatus Bipolaricaulota bacterium]|nr:RNA polymerase sigma factor [Candidatus Bipolaricaulota bacterium]